MTFTRLRTRAVTAGAAMLGIAAAAAVPSFADTPKIAVGTLTCKGHGGVGLIFGSKENMRCLFQTAVSGRSYPYNATITQVGIDIGFTGESTLVWTVLGSTTDLPANALEGSYGGVTAGATVGIGASANALVGGSSQSIVLQPVSVEGQTGLNISAGVAGLQLSRS
ncbi:DUF992 domain-containing protein [Hyphomicrobium sp.]|uniref:DUF992 domain-containing protein n=1 Tax=Hyphomicrobium sp. TaxID=82 RepID=UPI000FAF91EB|nr:DUF992 domain-containing protein [Hyphomicrobium sp.]RUO98785.1 MAG: DUF992 domain-containing protein [Hyphomicrobium sp.]